MFTSRTLPKVARVRSRRSRRDRGFTILEVMLATTIMAFAISTSILTLQSAFLSVDTARNITLARQIMMTEMEKMRLGDWATVSGYPVAATTVLVDPNFTDNPRIGNRFTLTRTVSLVGGDANLLQLTYTASWKGYNRHAHSRSYTTYYARYGIRDYLYNTT